MYITSKSQVKEIIDQVSEDYCINISKRLESLRLLSKSLSKLSIKLRSNELLALVRFINEAIDQSEEWFQRAQNMVLPRGSVIHIPSSNITLMAIYSWLPSYIAGNMNYIRLSRRIDEEYIKNVISEIDLAIGVDESRRQIFYSGKVEDEITAITSKVADARIIWGDNETINMIKSKYPTNASIEINFKTRYSASLIDSRFYLNSDEDSKERLSRQYMNDSLLLSFNACSSPHYTFWLGSDSINIKAQKDFICKIKKLTSMQDIATGAITTENIRKLQTSAAIDNLDDKVLEIIRGKGVIKVSSKRNKRLREDLLKGFIYYIDAKDLNELSNIFPHRIQTLTYIGIINSKVINQFLESLGERAPDRFVPTGEGLKFSLCWDGQNFLESLTRKVCVT